MLTYGEHVSRYLRRYRRGDSPRIVAPQAVEADLFGRTVARRRGRALAGRPGLPPAGPLVLYVGRLVREKGVEVLLRAWRRLDIPERDARARRRRPAARRGRGRACAYLGQVPREQLPVAYRAADAVVVPSLATRRFLEPWGLVCNEAMHAGTPVIASSAVGAAAGGLVVHGATGLIVRAGDDRDLAQTLEQLLGDGALHERISGLAARRFRTLHVRRGRRRRVRRGAARGRRDGPAS